MGCRLLFCSLEEALQPKDVAMGCGNLIFTTEFFHNFRCGAWQQREDTKL